MSVTHRVTRTIDRGSNDGSVIAFVESITCDSESVVDKSVATAVTNQLNTLGLTVANLKTAYMVSTADITVKTNSSGSPQETISLKANSPLVWTSTSGQTIPFAGNVTAFYLTNASGATADIKFRFGYSL